MWLKTAKKKICCTVQTLISRSVKLKYIRDFIICKQNMATNGVKNIRSSADPTVDSIFSFSLSFLGVHLLANYQIRL